MSRSTTKRAWKRVNYTRKLSALIASDMLGNRHPPTDIELAELLLEIDRHNTARYGMARLASIDVNHLFICPEGKGLITTKEGVFRDGKMSLLSYAVCRRSFDIVYSLIRSGADPSLRLRLQQRVEGGEGGGREVEGVPRLKGLCSALLNHYEAEHVKFLVDFIYKHRLKAFNEQGEEDIVQCMQCHSHYHNKDRDTAVTSLEGCGHIVCEVCLWKRLLASTTPRRGLDCPFCSKILPSELITAHGYDSVDSVDAIDDDGCCGRKTLSIELYEKLFMGFASNGDVLLNKVSNEDHITEMIKLSSSSLWKYVPSDAELDPSVYILGRPSSLKKGNGRKGKGKGKQLEQLCSSGLNLRQQRSLMVGKTKEHRISYLHAAATKGDYLKIAALINVGVDLESVNQYGHTSLMLAVYAEQLGAVRLLLTAGASIHATDCVGLNALDVAFTYKNTDIYNLLSAFGARKSLDTSTPLNLAYRSFQIVTSNYGDVNDDEDDGDKKIKQESTTIPKVVELISPQTSHPGAGSYYIDDLFSEEFLNALITLHENIIPAPNTKKSCSERSYYCDIIGWIMKEFKNRIESCFPLDHKIHSIPALHDDAFDDNLDDDLDDDLDDAEFDKEKEETKRIGYHSCMPYMRFLNYIEPGGGLPPHVDLNRVDSNGIISTHTFILYLSDCSIGGETVLLPSTSQTAITASTSTSKNNIDHEFTYLNQKPTKSAGEDEEIIDVAPLAVVTPRRGRLLVFPHLCPHEAWETVEVPKLLLRGEMVFY